MHCRKSILCLCLLSLFVGITAVSADPVQFQFYDPAGNLITDSAVDVVVGTEKMSLPPDSDGVYEVEAQPGQQARFKVYQGSSQPGSATVQIKIPQQPGGPIPITVPFELGAANDSCATPTPASVDPNSNNADNTIVASPEAANEAPFCGTTYDGAPGVWFSVIGTGASIRASTCETSPNPSAPDPWLPSADYDTKIHVYCLDCDTPTCITGNDDDLAQPGCGAPIFHSTVNWCSAPGVTYRILVSGFGASVGNFTLAVGSNGVSCGAPTGGACVPPPEEGACCLNGECPLSQGQVAVSCFQATQVDCEAAGGSYQGDNSSCVTPTGGVFAVHAENLNIAIPDNNTAGISHTINVASGSFVVDVNVNLDITHTWDGDLNIELEHSGVSANLWNGGLNPCTSADNINTTSDDQGTDNNCAQVSDGTTLADAHLDAVTPAAAGGTPLSQFIGSPAGGQWTLNIFDDFPADVGVLENWGLDFQLGTATCPDFECCPAVDVDPDSAGTQCPTCAPDPTTGTCNPCPADPVTGLCNQGPGVNPCLTCAPGPDGKVTICHFSGNGNGHTISISPNALPAHCNNHGDTCGPCAEDDDSEHPAWTIDNVGQQGSGAQTPSTDSNGPETQRRPMSRR